MQNSVSMGRAQALAPNFAGIPGEMSFYRQWIVWRMEDKGRSKLDKVPYSPFGGLASVTDASTWGSLDDARSAYQTGNFTGIGFVLTLDDPYAFIDLDDCNGALDCAERQDTIFNNTQSYAERSPSGTGLHIIVKGRVERGRKRAKVELYSDARYMTVTGHVYRDAPIADEGNFVQWLWHEMGGAAGSEPPLDSPQKADDAAVIASGLIPTFGARA